MKILFITVEVENSFKLVHADQLVVIGVVVHKEFFWDRWFSVLLTNDFIAVQFNELFRAKFVIMVQVILREHIVNGLLTVLAVCGVHIGEFSCGHQVIFIGVEVMEDADCHRCALVPTPLATAVAKDFAGQFSEFFKSE